MDYDMSLARHGDQDFAIKNWQTPLVYVYANRGSDVTIISDP
jgi:hypothetical protein